MFGIFKKKHDPSEIFSGQDWRIVQGEFQGNPLVVRVNSHLAAFAGDTELKLKIGFAVPLNTQVPGGLPEPEENYAIGAIEDKIIGALETKGPVVQALAITTGTFKEFVFYARPDIDIKSVHEALMRDISSHEIQCTAEMDPGWETYKQWANR